jgi:tetratricopeptide (TPR) repeat protein
MAARSIEVRHSPLLILLTLLFLNISPVHAETALEYLDQGNDSFKRGDLDVAILEFTKAIDANPNLSKAYDNRGVAYAREGSFPRAIADFTMAIANNPKDAEAYNNRGHAYYNQGNMPQAIFDYTRAIDMNAFYTKAYNNRELAYFKLEKYDKAWADVHTVKEIGGTPDPDFIETLKKASGRDQ